MALQAGLYELNTAEQTIESVTSSSRAESCKVS